MVGTRGCQRQDALVFQVSGIVERAGIAKVARLLETGDNLQALAIDMRDQRTRAVDGQSDSCMHGSRIFILIALGLFDGHVEGLALLPVAGSAEADFLADIAGQRDSVSAGKR